MNRRSLVAPLVFLTLFLPLHAIGANKVYVIDQANGPGTDFTSLSPLFFSFEDGDILLVRPGSYETMSIDNVALTLIGDPGPLGEKPIIKSISIRNLAPQKRVIVRGIVANPLPTSLIGLGASIFIDNNDGPIVIEDFESIQQASVYNKPTPIVVRNSDRVSLTRCLLHGPAATPQGGFNPLAEVGIRATNSTLFLYDSDVTGGDGTDAVDSFLNPLPSAPGADGVDLVTSTLVAVGSVITGGAGGSGLFNGVCMPSSNGGDAIRVEGTVTRIDTSLVGGAAGIDPVGCPQVGVAGLPLDVVSGNVITKNETARTYEVESPIRVGQQATTTLTGVPGEGVGLLLSVTAEVSYIPNLKGALVPGIPFQFVSLPSIPANGVLQFTLPVPSILPPGIEGIEVIEQVIVAGTSGFGFLSSPSAIVIVDSSF